MYQLLLQDPAFFAFLFHIDKDHAATVRLQGCSCGGPLHQANYARKPRGGTRVASVDTTRLSFCCGHCRVRHTPASVRFLARRVYWGAVVVLATALCSGVNLRRGRQLSQQLGVPVLTLLRWRHWWLTRFTTSAVWLDLRGRFLPPVAASDLPGELLHVHRELNEATPLQRFINTPSVLRDCPDSATLARHFRIEVQRTQRRSDGTVSLDGVRFEIPQPFAHLRQLTLRYARWAHSQADIVDARSGIIQATIYPLDKARNADGRRRRCAQ